jgi:hypothetical protein
MACIYESTTKINVCLCVIQYNSDSMRNDIVEYVLLLLYRPK